MKKSNSEELVKRVFGGRVPEAVYEALSDLDRTERDLQEAKNHYFCQAYHYNNLNDAKAKLFDLLTSDGMIVIGKISNRYEEV